MENEKGIRSKKGFVKALKERFGNLKLAPI